MVLVLRNFGLLVGLYLYPQAKVTHLAGTTRTTPQGLRNHV
jgi:hypothetical protein